MEKLVKDLSREQLDELKNAYFWGDETRDGLPDEIVSPEQIPDQTIFSYYADVDFVDDDFLCSAR